MASLWPPHLLPNTDEKEEKEELLHSLGPEKVNF